MNIKLAAALVLAVSLPLAGCGNKGPLTLSSPPTDLSAAPAPADVVPAEDVIEMPAAPATTAAPADVGMPVEPPVAPEGVQPAPATPPADGGNG